MHEVGNTFFDSPSGPFSGQIFHQCDTDYNLDYVDSNGQRHSQLLADYDFSKSPDNPLIKSQLYYFPAEAASKKEDNENNNFDIFVGIVESKPPTYGRQNIKKLSNEMMRQLDRMMRLNCEIDSYYDPEEDSATIFLTDEASEDIIAISIKALKMEDSPKRLIRYRIVLSSDPEQPLVQRHFDAMLSTELWTFLHNFGSGVSYSPANNSDSKDTTTTLKVGLDRAPDACRFGISLLEGLAAFDNLVTQEPTPRIAPDIRYEKLDAHFQSYRDDTLRRIVQRAIVLSYRSKEPVTTRSLLESIRFEQALASIISE